MKLTVQYYALVMDLGIESPYNKEYPTGLMRISRGCDGIIHQYEYYNPFKNTWVFDSYLYKYFSGDNDTAYPITLKEANHIIKIWSYKHLR